MTARDTDPYLAFRFEISIDGIVAGGFSAASGLELATTMQQYAEGGRNDFIHNLPGPVKQSNIVLKRGIVDRSLWNWYAELLKGSVVYKNGSIVIYSLDGADSEMRVDFLRAIPAKWSGPSLESSQAQVAVESLELAHHGLTWQS